MSLYFIQLACKLKKYFFQSECAHSPRSLPVLARLWSAAEQKKLRKAVAVITLAEIEQHASLPFFR